MSNVFYSSTYTEIHGNPDLKPFSYYNVNLMWQIKRRYTLMAFASLKPDYSVQLPYQTTDRRWLSLMFHKANGSTATCLSWEPTSTTRATISLTCLSTARSCLSSSEAPHP